ncbi:FG-GAP repeat domain-containing protein [Adhaeretor mobilis]|uniref:FG-GAP repeat protein n=1 Tax=Adhaeretor mobilis TaxID=1930276 RepID=A0A517MVD4_9BACT|nr:VCBS repeat-containing protein [Adhaeretor mobilis]QDS98747.1 FG-GAP repeat protein [Adhaeretor mobilis]
MTRRSINLPRTLRRLGLEQLEARHLLTAVPFGPEIVIDTNEASDILIAFADLDGDGDLDMVGGDDGLFWYENTDGDGTFGAPQTIADAIVDEIAVNVRDIEVGDIDRDGDLDVLASSVTDSAVGWWANDGSGNFGARNLISGQSSVGASVELVDYDSDGDLDVLANGDSVDIYANDGSGSFSSDGNFSFAINYLDTANFDRDGSIDVVAADVANDQIVLRTAAGTAVVAVNDPGNLVAIDLDGDGDQDVVATSEGDGSLLWYQNDSSLGNFFAGGASPLTIDNSLLGAFDVQAGDFDADGDLDLLASGTAGDTIAWYENDGAANPMFVRHNLTTAANGAENVAIADIDGDGDLDVSYVSSSDNRRVWRRNMAIHAAHTINDQSEVTIESTIYGAIFATTADIDGDGDLDVLGVSLSLNIVAWWENTSVNGSAWTEHTIDGDFIGAESVRTADVDGDGDLDVVGAAQLAGEIAWWENTSGDGFAWTKHAIDGSFVGASSINTADVDGDGDIDVLGTSQNDDDVAWWENTSGDGSAWTKHTIDSSFDFARSVITADVDGDGDLDVLALAPWDMEVTWWENTLGDGSAWNEHTIDNDLAGVYSVSTADVDGDGDLDALGAALSGEMVWWENSAGDGTVWTEYTIGSNFSGDIWVSTADLDGDGDLDVLGAGQSLDDVAWWENTSGDGSVWAIHAIDGDFTSPRSVVPADIDGDGDLDVLAAAFEASSITWWENRREQARLTTTDITPPEISTGATAALLRIDFAHLGQLGEPSAKWESITLRIEDQYGAALSDSLAKGLIERLELYRDDGDGVFNGADSLIASAETFSLTDGALSLLLADDDPNREVTASASESFFVVVSLPSEPESLPQNQFRVSHITGDVDDNLITYADSDEKLLTLAQPNTPSSVVEVSPILSASLTQLDATPTNASAVRYSVEFSDEVTGVGIDDFSLATTGSAAGSVSSVTEITPSSYEVTIGTVTGAGTLRLDLVDDDSILDTGGKPLGSYGVGNGKVIGEAYEVDRVAPLVTSILLEGTNLTSADTVSFLVNFGEAVSGVDTSDFSLASTETAAGNISEVAATTANQYRVTVDSISGDGTLQLNLVDDDSIIDSVLNPLAGAGNGNGEFAGEFFSIDNTGPSVLSIVTTMPTATSLATLTYEVTFDEPVEAVDNSDFELITTGTVSGFVQSVTGSGTVRTITIANVVGEGTLRLDLNDDDSVLDLVGNALGGTGTNNGDFAGEVYTLDHLPPEVLGIVRFDAEAVYGAPLRFLVNFNESVIGVDSSDFEITTTDTASGTIGTITELLPSSYLVEIDNIEGEGTIGLNLVDDDSIIDTVADPAPLPLGGVGTSNGDAIGQVYTLATPPTGDFDIDGDVDGADFLVWQRGFGTTYDADDLQDWSDNYGNPAASSAAATNAFSAALTSDDTLASRVSANETPTDGAFFLWSDEEDQAAEPALLDETAPSETTSAAPAIDSRALTPAADAETADLYVSGESEAETAQQEWLSEELLERVFGS